MVPSDVAKKVAKDERAIHGYEPEWQEALAFFGGDQYVEISAVTGQLDRLEVREGGAKPRWRPRTQRNRLTRKVVAEASFLTSRIPSFDVDPPGGDPGADNQAQLGERILRWQFENLKLGDVAVDTIIYAILTGAGFVWPYWDSYSGDYIGEHDGAHLHEGDICASVLHQGEVLWETGVPFEESSWWCVRKAQPVDQVKANAEMNADNITPDAKQGLWEKPGTERGELVFKYEYLEKPKKGGKGRWLTFANDRIIKKERPFPRRDGKCPLHMVRWFPQRYRGRHLGAGPALVAAQRGYNRTHNQITQWKNLTLIPQLMAPEGSIIGEYSDEPGIVIQYRLRGGAKPEFRPVPEVPDSLFVSLDRALQDMDDVLGSHETPEQLESGSAIQADIERSSAARSMFIRHVAEWWGDLGLHILELTQAGYTEERLILVDGKFGPDRIPDFLGRDLGRLGRVSVRPDSIAPRSRQEQEGLIQYYADRQWIEPHQAMKALDAGTADVIINELMLDESKQHREIQRMQTLEARLTGSTADGTAAEIVDLEDAGRMSIQSDEFPMPMPNDNHVVHQDVLRQWMKTRDFERQHPMVQAWAQDHDAAHQMEIDLQQQKEAQQAMLQAQELGMGNASRPPAVGQPSMPAQGQAGAPTE
jgi:hypothetical protein